jgi:prevent-host-death family protein
MEMPKISISNATAELEELLKRVARGEEIHITRDGKTVARLLPPEPKEKRIAGDSGKAQALS